LHAKEEEIRQQKAKYLVKLDHCTVGCTRKNFTGWCRNLSWSTGRSGEKLP